MIGDVASFDFICICNFILVNRLLQWHLLFINYAEYTLR